VGGKLPAGQSSLDDLCPKATGRRRVDVGHDAIAGGEEPTAVAQERVGAVQLNPLGEVRAVLVAQRGLALTTLLAGSLGALLVLAFSATSAAPALRSYQLAAERLAARLVRALESTLD
jgi:hypothetical protein